MNNQESWQGQKVRYCKVQKGNDVLFPTVSNDLGSFVSLSSGNRKSLYKKLVALSILNACPLSSFIGEKTHSELISIHKAKLKRHALSWLAAEANGVPLLEVNYRRQIAAFGALQQIDKTSPLGYRDYAPTKETLDSLLASLPDVVQVPDNLI